MTESLRRAPEIITTLFVDRLYPNEKLKVFLNNKIKIMKRKNAIWCIKKECSIF